VVKEDNVERKDYRIFSQGRIGRMTVKNRLVRSATGDVIVTRKVIDRIITIYTELAKGGVGLIITGELPIGERPELRDGTPHYSPLWFDGLEKIAEVVHEFGDGCRIVAQVGAEAMGLIGSDYPDRPEYKRVVDTDEFPAIIDNFIWLICRLKEAGFDGVQLHGAHGYFLCSLLSPYSNRRTDDYGGTLENRVRIIREIVTGARQTVGDFPILIKAPCDDFVEGGLEATTFPDLAEALVQCGLDAIEISTGVDPGDISDKKRIPTGSLLLEPHARNLNLEVPLILVSGIRDVEKAESVLLDGTADFVSMCRPFISEPDLPFRWLEGLGRSHSDCIDCNCCRISNYPDFGILNECVYKHHRDLYNEMKAEE
jgi:2,4-dienoyl-CoA reductase-like NADH-dependent reductase (Old Yellow Enzyme family)